MKIVHASNSDFSELWQKLFSEDELQYPLLSNLDVEYSKEYDRDSQFEDASFIIEENHSPIMGVRMAKRFRPDGREELSGFGRPIAYLESRESDSSRRDGATKVLREELQRILQENSFASVYYQELRPALSPVARCLLDAGAKAKPRFTQIIDLSVAEPNLRQQVRKSYKSLINWGTKNLELSLVDEATVTPEAMEEFRRLHCEAAGRETRSDRSWEFQYEMVQHNEAFAIFGQIGGALVTAALFLHSPNYCYYGVSASKREMFEKPLGHCLLWTAILHSKSFGCHFFETGEQLFPNQGSPPPTTKELGISAFKRGLGGETTVRLDIGWDK